MVSARLENALDGRCLRHPKDLRGAVVGRYEQQEKAVLTQQLM